MQRTASFDKLDSNSKISNNIQANPNVYMFLTQGLIRCLTDLEVRERVIAEEYVRYNFITYGLAYASLDTIAEEINKLIKLVENYLASVAPKIYKEYLRVATRLIECNGNAFKAINPVDQYVKQLIWQAVARDDQKAIKKITQIFMHSLTDLTVKERIVADQSLKQIFFAGGFAWRKASILNQTINEIIEFLNISLAAAPLAVRNEAFRVATSLTTLAGNVILTADPINQYVTEKILQIANVASVSTFKLKA